MTCTSGSVAASSSAILPVPSGELSSVTSTWADGANSRIVATSGRRFSASLYVASETTTRAGLVVPLTGVGSVTAWRYNSGRPNTGAPRAVQLGYPRVSMAMPAFGRVSSMLSVVAALAVVAPALAQPADRPGAATP